MESQPPPTAPTTDAPARPLALWPPPPLSAFLSPGSPHYRDLAAASQPLKGKTILITGGASGLGAACCRRWASLGAGLVVGDLAVEAGEALVAELNELAAAESGEGEGEDEDEGGSVMRHWFRRCDVSDWQSQVDFFRFAVGVAPEGRIDCVVPNAGIGGGQEWEWPSEDVGLVAEEDEDEEDLKKTNGETGTNKPKSGIAQPAPPRFKVMDINLTAVMWTVHLAIYWLPRNGTKTVTLDPSRDASAPGNKEFQWPRDRHILLMSSIGGLLPLVGASQYTVSKHGVTAIFRSLRGPLWRRYGVRVNMLCPCFIDTPLLSNEVLFMLAGGGVVGKMEDVVEAATRLVADERLVGRGVVVGARVRVRDVDLDRELVKGADEEQGEGELSGIWECYAQDYQNVEAFIYRYTRVLVALARLRGWFGWLFDVLWLWLYRKPTKKKAA